MSCVTALDLEQPLIDHDRIHCVKGDVTALDFSDGSFDLVFCAEVLEHIPTTYLATACHELSRVSNRYLLIGVPYEQDIRVGRTTCRLCGKCNPPWAHVNRFDECRLRTLFPACEVVNTSFVGTTKSRTNSISCFLHGHSWQSIRDVLPGRAMRALWRVKLASPPERSLLQKVFTKIAMYAMNAQAIFVKEHPNWIHVLFSKRMT